MRAANGIARRAEMRFVFLSFILISLGSAESRLHAQSTNGTIRGQLRDTSGASIPAGTLTLRDVQKGLEYTAHTDSAGMFQFLVPGGTYDLTAGATNFSSKKESGIQLLIAQETSVNIELPVAAVHETIQVDADLPLVTTIIDPRSYPITRERLDALPLNGRDFSQLALLQPGVVANQNGANSPFGGRWATFVVNGQLDQSTLFLMDGSELNDLASGRNPSGSSGLLLGLDSVQEFQVLLSNYKAEFGKNSGGVIHVATRGGTNTLHGAAFEYLRNSALDAKNFFDLADRPIPSFRRNQFGASLGGPLRRDQTFYFLSYEGLRERKAITSKATVPAAAVRAGAAPNVVPFLNLYPLPNGPLDPDGRTASYSSSVVQPAREDFGLVRLDHRLLNEWNLNAKYSTQDSLVEPPYPSTPVPGFPQSLPHRMTNALVSLTAPFSASLLGELHFAFNRTFGAIELPPAPGGLVITPVAGRNFGLINVTGISNLGTQTFVPRAAQNLFEISAQLSHLRGKHSMKYGVTVQRYQDNELRGTFFNGQYTFAGVTQFLAGTPASWLGVLDGTNAGGPASPAGWRWTTTSAFAQDDFEVSRRLTLNLGLRYEFTSSPTDVLGQIANLCSPLDAQITYGGQFFNTIARSFAPRFGFALEPRGEGRSALRGGFGVFYNPLVVNMWANSRLVPPFVNTVLLAGGPPFPNPLATGRVPALSTTGQAIDYNLSQPYAMQYNIEWQQQISQTWVVRAAYAGNRSLHILRSLESNPGTPTILADGRKCFNFAAASGGPNPACPSGSTVRRNLNFGPIRGRSSDGRSWYDSLQLTAERRISGGSRGGSTVQASYTWSKALSTNNSSFTSFPSQPSNTQDPDDIYVDKAVSAFDVRHRLAAHAIVTLPSFGTGALHYVASGWRIATIGSLSSGYPFTVVDGINRSQNLQTDVALADRPDWAAGASPETATEGLSRSCIINGQERFGGRKIDGPDLYFDPCAFALQPSGFYGNVGRNALTGPGFFNLDLSLNRTFAVHERQQFEFRADFFNVLNRPNLATPSSPTGAQVSGGAIVFPDATGVPAGNAGQIFRTVSDSRQIQFSLRYSF